MSTSKRYIVTCLKCGEKREVGIIPTVTGDRVDWLENDPNERIVSGRQRLDGQWGWECLCGNNSIMSTQERETFTNKVNPDPQEIKQVVDNLRPEKTYFTMEVK